MSVESEVYGAEEIGVVASTESGSRPSLRSDVMTTIAASLFIAGLDLSRLPEEELDGLRIYDMLYLTIAENKRRFAAAIEIVKTLHPKRDPEAPQIRGGILGRAVNYLSSLNSDQHNHS